MRNASVLRRRSTTSMQTNATANRHQTINSGENETFAALSKIGSMLQSKLVLHAISAP